MGKIKEYLFKIFGKTPVYQPRTESELRQDLSFDDINKIQKYVDDETRLNYSRKSRYDDYDDMDTFCDISSILDIYADESTPFSHEQQAYVWVESDNTNVKKALDDMFARVKLDELVWSWARNLAKYGDNFERIFFKPGEGIMGFDYRQPQDMQRIQDKSGRLLAFIDNSEDCPEKEDTGGKYKYLPPWEYVHFRLLHRRDLSRMYGIGMLEALRKNWRESRVMDKAMVVYRVKMQADRWVFYIPVMADSVEGQQRELKLWRRYIKKRQYLNPESAEYFSNRNPLMVDEDIFLPAFKGDIKSFKIEKLAGSANVSDIADIDYKRRQIATGAKLPMSYLGYTDVGGLAPEKTLAMQDVRLARHMNRLQRGLVEGIVRICQIELALKGDDEAYPYGVDGFDVMMRPVSVMDEDQQIDFLQRKMTLATEFINALGQMGIDIITARAFVLSRFMGLSADQIAALKSGQVPAETPSFGGFGGMGGMSPFSAPEAPPSGPEVGAGAPPETPETAELITKAANLVENNESLKKLFRATIMNLRRQMMYETRGYGKLRPNGNLPDVITEDGSDIAIIDNTGDLGIDEDNIYKEEPLEDKRNKRERERRFIDDEV